MSKTSKLDISESVELLRSLMKSQKTGLGYAKVQALYLLKINAVETVRYLAVILGRSEATIYHWLYLYRTGGLDKLLEKPPKTGITRKETPKISKILLKLPYLIKFTSYKLSNVSY